MPGGTFMIFNICPAPTPADKPFIPWSDGRSPYTKAQYEAAGFKVVEMDRDDFKAAPLTVSAGIENAATTRSVPSDVSRCNLRWISKTAEIGSR